MLFGSRQKIVENILWSMERNLKNYEKNFDSDLVFADKYLKIKIKSYNNEISTNFNDEAPKKPSALVCLQ